MFESSYILLFLLSVGGLFVNVIGENIQDQNSIVLENTQDVSRANYGIVTFIPRRLFMMLISRIKDIIDLLWDSYYNTSITTIQFHVMDFLTHLTSSENKTLMRRPRSTFSTNEQYEQENGSGTLASMLSAAFMMPFKAVAASTRLIPVNSIIQRMKKMFMPLNKVINNFMVQGTMDTVVLIAESIGAQLWNFTKSSILPRLDKGITSLDNTKTMPESIMTLLRELQTLYHIFQLFGMM